MRTWRISCHYLQAWAGAYHGGRPPTACLYWCALHTVELMSAINWCDGVFMYSTFSFSHVLWLRWYWNCDFVICQCSLYSCHVVCVWFSMLSVVDIVLVSVLNYLFIGHVSMLNMVLVFFLWLWICGSYVWPRWLLVVSCFLYSLCVFLHSLIPTDGCC